ncbi:hypothetical protein [Companilactobacillus hulinensis]|uniref:hypothetical protein n=1 Tax=Companilactobacillus hulinensis TaxID=2486007 RepID=UPI001CDBE840|nr:hypothetical protein [Companilactobacillus hulinensis]
MTGTSARDYSREKVVTGLGSDYNNIKLTDSQKYTNLKIKSGDWGTKINEDKQLPHMESSHAPGKRATYLIVKIHKSY